jgi:hypothetical protein
MCEFHEDIKFNTISQNHDENQLTLIEKLTISADAENTVKMFDKLNDELEEERKRIEMKHEEDMKRKEMNHKEEIKMESKERIALFDELVAKNYEDMSFIDFGIWFLNKISQDECLLDESDKIGEQYDFTIKYWDDFEEYWGEYKMIFIVHYLDENEEYESIDLITDKAIRKNVRKGITGFYDLSSEFTQWFVKFEFNRVSVHWDELVIY